MDEQNRRTIPCLTQVNGCLTGIDIRGAKTLEHQQDAPPNDAFSLCLGEPVQRFIDGVEGSPCARRLAFNRFDQDLAL